MITIFYEVLRLSFVGSMAFMVIMGLGKLLHKNLDSSWRFNLLKINLLLFVLPLSNVVSSLIPQQTILDSMVRIQNVTTSPRPAQASGVSQVSQASPALVATTVTIDWLMIAGSIWVAVGVGLAIYYIYKYAKFSKLLNLLKLRDIPNSHYVDCLNREKSQLSIDKEVDLLNSQLHTPALVGFNAPIILLPAKEFDEDELSYIFKHELIHLKRKDLWWKLLSQIIVVLHFFNPIVYILQKEFIEQLECSCDELVVKGLSMENKKQYGLIILDNVNVSSVHMGLGFGTPKQQVERRLRNMLNNNKASKWTKLITAGCLLGATTAIYAASADVTANSAIISSSEAIDFSDSTINGLDRLPNTPEQIAKEAHEFVFRLKGMDIEITDYVTNGNLTTLELTISENGSDEPSMIYNYNFTCEEDGWTSYMEVVQFELSDEEIFELVLGLAPGLANSEMEITHISASLEGGLVCVDVINGDEVIEMTVVYRYNDGNWSVMIKEYDGEYLLNNDNGNWVGIVPEHLL
ncbi:MAG: hypothetical protein BEN19_00770 [Epulopiscium sp. Nuni2H_MBin003]|nr:MAG: hypothetical protein BEN19_00770 [Epulopiscium sp. Nuni2H_MBin003]